MSFIDSSLNAAKRSRNQDHAFKGEHRRVPFAQKEAARLAGDNVVEHEAELPEIIALAHELIRAHGAGRRTKVWKKIRRLAGRVRRRQIDAARHEPVHWDADALTLIRYLETQLSPARNQKIINQICTTLGLDVPMTCATTLLGLPKVLYQPLVRLDMPAIRSALAGFIIDHRGIDALFRTLWKYRLVAVAHHKATALADVAREPNGFKVAGPLVSPSMGHIFLRTVTAPAMVVNGIVTLLQTLSLPADDDQAAIEALISAGLLEEEHVDILAGAARTVRHRISMDANTGMTIDVMNCLRFLADGARPAALLVNGDMDKAGLAKREPIDHLLGLTGAEALAFIAEQLLSACATVDTSTWSARGMVRTRGPKPTLPSATRVGVVANIFAHEHRPYRYASGTRGIRDAATYDPLSADNKPMRGVVRRMRRKLGGRGYSRIAGILAIEPHDWVG